MKISNIMNSKIVTVDIDDTLKMIKEIFDHTCFHHLLVIENHQLCGIISDRDLFKAFTPTIGTAAESTQDLTILNQKAHQIMNHHPISLPESANVKDAIKVFNDNNISCIPIVNEQKEPVGILSWRDIFRIFSYLRI